MDTQTPVYVTTVPTPKEQIVAGAIGLGLMAASVAVVYGAFVAVDKVNEYRLRRRAKKETQQTAE